MKFDQAHLDRLLHDPHVTDVSWDRVMQSIVDDPASTTQEREMAQRTIGDDGSAIDCTKPWIAGNTPDSDLDEDYSEPHPPSMLFVAAVLACLALVAAGAICLAVQW